MSENPPRNPLKQAAGEYDATLEGTDPTTEEANASHAAAKASFNDTLESLKDLPRERDAIRAEVHAEFEEHDRVRAEAKELGIEIADSDPDDIQSAETLAKNDEQQKKIIRERLHQKAEKAGKAVVASAGGVAGVGVAYGAAGAIAAPVIESGVASVATGTGWAAWLLKALGPLALFGAFLYKLKDIPNYLAQVANGEKLKIPAAKGGGGGKKDDHGHGGGGGGHH